MNKLLKWIVLTAALVIPVTVFIFLKLFGRNEFEVPPLFTIELPRMPADCANPVTVPYKIPDNVRARLGITHLAPLYLITDFPPDEVLTQRLEHAFTRQELKVIAPILASNSHDFYSIQPDSLAFIKNCFLFVPEQKDKVLVDSAGQIRGYYGSSREETDKLILEASIILRKY